MSHNIGLGVCRDLADSQSYILSQHLLSAHYVLPDQDDMLLMTMLNRVRRTRVAADLQEHYKTTENSTVRVATHTEHRYRFIQHVTEVTLLYLSALN